MDTTRDHDEGMTAGRAASSRPGPGSREPSAGRAPDEGGSIRNAVKEKAAAVKDEAKARAGEMVDRAKQRATEAVNDQKGRVAAQIGGVASALREGTRKLRESDAAAVAPWADEAADRIESVGNYIRDKNAGDMAQDVQGFARRHPEVFIGGAVLLGFAVARFLKSSARGTGEGEEYGYGTGSEEDEYGDGQLGLAGAGPPTAAATPPDIIGATHGLPADNPAIASGVEGVTQPGVDVPGAPGSNPVGRNSPPGARP